MVLTKVPVPELSIVLKFAVVGFETVFQQTPRLVTAAPPSAVTLPPLNEAVPVMAVTAVVLIIGAVAVGTGVGGVGVVVDGFDLLQPAKNNTIVIAIRVNLIFIKKALGRVYMCNNT
jgi:hypothetical protein